MHLVTRRAIATTLAVALPLSAASPAMAMNNSTAEPFPATSPLEGLPEDTQTDELSAAEMEQLEKDVEVLFTEYIILGDDDRFRVNETNVSAAGHADKIPQLESLASVLNEDTTPRPFGGDYSDLASPMCTTEFAKCLAWEGLGIPAIEASPSLIQTIKDGIRTWNWQRTAKAVAKVLGAGTVRALGGPIGIGVSLAAGAVTCRKEL